MNYQRIYNEIVTRAKTENRKKRRKTEKDYVYYERHHIRPRCMGGTNDKDNLVLLTAREHFLCHLLLCEVYPNEHKLKTAVWLMSIQNNPHQERLYRISSRLYKRLKEYHIDNLTKSGFGGDTISNHPNKNTIINKFKQRAKPKPRFNMTTVKNLLTGRNESISIEKFNNNVYYVGIRCKGLYITPFGNFFNTELFKTKLGMDMVSMVKKCKQNYKKINKRHFQNRSNFPNSDYYRNLQENLGKTFKDAGYNFIPISNLIGLNLKYFNKLNIHK